IVIEEIEAICRSFLWTGVAMYRRKALVSWDGISVPMKQGGLLIKNLKIWAPRCKSSVFGLNSKPPRRSAPQPAAQQLFTISPFLELPIRRRRRRTPANNASNDDVGEHRMSSVRSPHLRLPRPHIRDGASRTPREASSRLPWMTVKLILTFNLLMLNFISLQLLAVARKNGTIEVVSPMTGQQSFSIPDETEASFSPDDDPIVGLHLFKRNKMQQSSRCYTSACLASYLYY
ncbi:hypothetical protein AKJ16_DCAP26383, partial [Drosera capensis]